MSKAIYSILIASLTMGLMAGCGDAQSEVSAVVEPLSKSSELPQSHAQIIEFVNAAYIATKEKDAKALMLAAQGLNAISAGPVTGTDDLAKSWVISANQINVNAGVKTPIFRGRVKGPAYRQQKILAGSEETITEIYYAAEAAEMTLKAMDGAVLNWQIIEEAENEAAVCAGQVSSDPQSCMFTPLWTSKYRIKISNMSDHAATYLFITN